MIDWGQFLTPGQLAQAAAVAGIVRLIIVPMVKRFSPQVQGWATAVWALGGGLMVAEIWAVSLGHRTPEELAASVLVGLAAGAMAIGSHQAGQALSANADTRAKV